MRDTGYRVCLPQFALGIPHTLCAHDIRRMHTTHWPRLTRRSRCAAAANNVRRDDATTYNEQRTTWPSVRTRRHGGSFPPCTPMSSNACNDGTYPLLEWSGEFHCCVPQAACCFAACCISAAHLAREDPTVGCTDVVNLHTREIPARAACKSSAPCCNAAHPVATQCTLLQRSAPCCNAAHPVATQRTLLQRSAACCNAVQPVATQCSLLQHVAPCGLPRAAGHWASGQCPDPTRSRHRVPARFP